MLDAGHLIHLLLDMMSEELGLTLGGSGHYGVTLGLVSPAPHQVGHLCVVLLLLPPETLHPRLVDLQATIILADFGTCTLLARSHLFVAWVWCCCVHSTRVLILSPFQAPLTLNCIWFKWRHVLRYEQAKVEPVLSYVINHVCSTR